MPILGLEMADSGTILLVEDEESVQKLLAFPLERDGFHVLQARDGEEAIELFGRHDVDLVVLDLMLPYLSGYQILIEARKNPRWLDVPIVVVTARTLEMDAVRALESGANDFVRKPYQPEELLARIKRAIELSRRRTAL